MTERLQKCLDAGSVVGLFPLLHDWSRAELEALMADVELFHQELEAKVDCAFRELAFQPQTFFSNQQSQALAQATSEARMHAMIICSEICSVALFYLESPKDLTS